MSIAPMTPAEWDWVKAHPDDSDARFLIRMAALATSSWTHVEAGLTEAAIASLRRTIAREAA